MEGWTREMALEGLKFQVGTHSLGSSKKLESILDRFIKLLGERYRGEYRYIPYSPDSKDWQLIQSLLFRKQVLTINEQIYFPVYLGSDLFGVIQRHGHKLDAPSQNRILDLVDLILGESLGLLVKEEGVARMEMQLQDKKDPDVVHISTFKKYRSQPQEIYDGFSEKHHKILNIPTLIEAQKIEEALRTALDLHSESGRFAFINYWELSESVRQNRSSLDELGPVSVYLPYPHLLNEKEQSALKAHLQQPLNEKTAFWLTATTIPYADLLRDRNLSARLLKQLSISFLRIQKTTENLLGLGTSADLH